MSLSIMQGCRLTSGKNRVFLIIALLVVGAFTLGCKSDVSKDSIIPSIVEQNGIKIALLADGCFWCAESDLEKVEGVLNVISGYAGGNTENPTYENYEAGGHREVVWVEYDSSIVSFGNLVENILKHGDPTDSKGSFGDRGEQYAPAIYFETEEEKEVALNVISAIDEMKVYPSKINIAILPVTKFYPAEDYHQDYAKKNPLRYGYYRERSGRDAFIEKYWRGEENEFTASESSMPKPDPISVMYRKWESFQKPSDDELRLKLSALEFEVTQNGGTERPFDNEFDSYKRSGIYVDKVSGEPLFSSIDKFDSGTGWPSFVRPITPNALTLLEDNTFFTKRTELRSRYGDSHLGHVFDDGPQEQGGLRYCINSAALDFIPIEEMNEKGYGDFIPKFQESS